MSRSSVEWSAPPESSAQQHVLSAEQVETFYHDRFVEDQTRHFIELVGGREPLQVVDVGGGCGFFARALSDRTAHKVRVLDTDSASIAACLRAGIEAVQGDALSPSLVGDEDVVCFNMILHHLVGASEAATLELQRKALGLWRGKARAVFVDEYIYGSFFGEISGWLIYQITKSPTLSFVGRMVSTLAPSLRANTFGTGVRFRGHREWVRVFESAGYQVRRFEESEDEPISLPRRFLLIKYMRRTSFLLEPRVS